MHSLRRQTLEPDTPGASCLTSLPWFLIYKKEIVIVPTLQVAVLIKKDGVYRNWNHAHQIVSFH